ncbi:uncharacterized protein HaLaN_21657, partial [Haematococcus lacustris]
MQAELKELRNSGWEVVLKKARVIGCTVTGAASHKALLDALQPGVLLVEEAGELLEAHVLTSLSTKTKHLVLIGDHKQLRPKVESYSLQKESGRGYDLNVSLFERLVLAGFPHASLAVQHRMHPDISRLVRPTYPTLHDHPSVAQHPAVKGLGQHRVVFIHHEVPEDEQEHQAVMDQAAQEERAAAERLRLEADKLAAEKAAQQAKLMKEMADQKRQLAESSAQLLQAEADRQRQLQRIENDKRRVVAESASRREVVQGKAQARLLSATTALKWREAVADAGRDKAAGLEALGQLLQQAAREQQEGSQHAVDTLDTVFGYGSGLGARLLHLLRVPAMPSSGGKTDSAWPDPLQHLSKAQLAQRLLSEQAATFAATGPLMSGPASGALQPREVPAGWLKRAKTSQALSKLLQLTGLEPVKREMFNLADQVELEKSRKRDLNNRQYNICFYGNPGTGKTTVARIYAALLKELGVLPDAQVVETSGSALANGGVEQLKKELTKLEKGGVLFVDEAYQLNPRTNPSGAAVLDYLLPEMENRRGKLVTVLAGYQKQMESLLGYNEGLPSR